MPPRMTLLVMELSGLPESALPALLRSLTPERRRLLRALLDECNPPAFPKYRPARAVWAEFLDWWGGRHPGRGLPRTAHVVTLTGLSRAYVVRRRALTEKDR